MGIATTRTNPGFVLTVSVLCLLPALAYFWLVARAPMLDVKSARQLLEREETQVVFVEPVDDATYALFRGATSVPFEEIRRQRDRSFGVAVGHEKPTLLICRSGIKSAIAAQHLRALGFPRVYSVKGGQQEWIALGGGLDAREIKRRGLAPEVAWPRFRRASGFEQALLVLSFFGVKSIYTVLAASLVVVLWRQTSDAYVALRRALFAFLIGESCCFGNVMFYSERSVPLEHGHGLFMALSLGFAAYAVSLSMNLRGLPQVGEGHCAMVTICVTCSKQVNAVCRFSRVAIGVVPALALLALLPVFATVTDFAYPVLVLGRLHGYGHPVVHQLFEFRYLPVVAALLLVACEFTLIRKEPKNADLSARLFAAAAGALGFSFLRLVFLSPFVRDQLWFAFWEELTELFYIGAMGLVLWAFRPALFAGNRRVS